MRRLRPDRLASGLLPICVLFVFPFLARADGGTVRLSERQGQYRLTVFTAPTPLRAGTVDVSVLVQDATTGEPASDVQVMVQAVARGSPALAMHHPATTEAATNKLYYAATFDMPEPGWYALTVSVAGARGEAQVHLELEAADPLPAWLALWPWVVWPIIVILLFGIHQVLVRRGHSGSLAHRTRSRAEGDSRTNTNKV
jgi:hypothetical protein